MSLGTFTGCGRVLGEPVMRYTQAGKACLSLTIAFAQSKRDDTTGEWVTQREELVRTTVWDQAAENAAESLYSGCEVIVHGRRYVRHYEHDGQHRLSIECTADSIGVSLRAHPATVRKPQRSRAPAAATAPDETPLIGAPATPGEPPF